MDAGVGSRFTPEPQEAKFVLKIQLTREEFVRAWRRYSVRRPQQWVQVLAWVGVYGEGVLKHSATLKDLALLLGSYFLAAAWAIAPGRVWSRCGYRESYVLEVATSGVTTRRPGMRTKFAWSRFTSFMKCGDVYILRLKRGLLFAPVRTLPEGLDEQTFCDFVARCLVSRGPHG
jgi:hypothetical protein